MELVEHLYIHAWDRIIHRNLQSSFRYHDVSEVYDIFLGQLNNFITSRDSTDTIMVSDYLVRRSVGRSAWTVVNHCRVDIMYWAGYSSTSVQLTIIQNDLPIGMPGQEWLNEVNVSCDLWLCIDASVTCPGVICQYRYAISGYRSIIWNAFDHCNIISIIIVLLWLHPPVYRYPGIDSSTSPLLKSGAKGAKWRINRFIQDLSNCNCHFVI